MKLSMLYRGPLASCNYACPYCPFAKHTETLAEHEQDRQALERFVGWATTRHDDDLRIFFTPWGEALVRRRYQQAIARLSHLPQVSRVAIQTNLSCKLDWLAMCDLPKVALWATFHPGEVARPRFVAKCHELAAQGVRFSVGVVGLKAHADAIAALRQELPAGIYLWINAYKRDPRYYSDADMRRFTAIDPLFPLNTVAYPSAGRACQAGETVISVDGDGTMRRCHFIKTPIGNLYDPDFATALRPRRCTNRTCGCHIGYVHMDDLGLAEVFGDGILERIPTAWERAARSFPAPTGPVARPVLSAQADADGHRPGE